LFLQQSIKKEKLYLQSIRSWNHCRELGSDVASTQDTA
jgi:hypothetical protein